MTQVVILIGDSIRMGYQNIVAGELEPMFPVIRPESNGGNSTNVLGHLDEWVIKYDPAVVHLNCGLHDIKKDFDVSTAAVPIELYRDNLHGIFSGIRAETRAQVIWASTTPVNQVWHHERKGFDRFETDVVAYNQAAREIVVGLGIPVCDLYTLVMQTGRDQILAADGVHFVEAGSAILGQAVAAKIRRYLRTYHENSPH